MEEAALEVPVRDVPNRVDTDKGAAGLKMMVITLTGSND